MAKFQLNNSQSNAQVGKDFENVVFDLLTKEFSDLEKDLSYNIGFRKKKSHKFDLGSRNQNVIIECKSHTWTKSYKVPSAKLTTWAQAILNFSLAPPKLNKIFIVIRDYSTKKDKTLCEYYLGTHNHLIPKDVEFPELDEDKKELKIIYRNK